MKKLIILESLRGFASIYVAIGHLILSLKDIPSYISILFRFGQEAVIIFFILSGFVIFFSKKKNSSEPLNKYFIKRFRRIYFPLICAIIVSIIFVNQRFSYKDLMGNLLMLQDFATAKPGNIVNPFLGNAPLWSLSYEWLFYMIFPFVFAVIGQQENRSHIVGLFSLINLIIYILYPNHIFAVFSYFIIWWTGLELAEYFIGDSSKRQFKPLFIYYFLIIFILLIKCFVSSISHHLVEIGIYPYLFLRHFVFACICLVLSIYSTSFVKKLTYLVKPFSFIAPISYGIYILHYPIWVQSHFALSSFFELLLKVILVFLLAYVVEIILQPKINKILK